MADRTASIIIPTYKEAPNIRPLVQRIMGAVNAAEIRVEILIVDDNSQDGSGEIVESLHTEYPVRLIVRENERGLAGAVIAGFREAKFDPLIVLDADLQHPPEAIPMLLERLNQPGCDFAIATRYAGQAEIDDSWSRGRRLLSRLATLVARPLAPISDPMSGFFALRKATLDRAAKLNPVGFKIALELYVKCGCRHPAEIPIRFSIRGMGKSKADLRQGLRFLFHLASLYWFKWPVAMATLLAVAGGSSIAVAILLYRIAVRSLGIA